MALTTVVPFRAGGKSRLPAAIRVEVALAMLGDVLEAATAFGPTRLVTADAAARHDTEVTMVPAVAHPLDPLWPATWPTDGRAGGVPAPATVGPSWIQIGTEGGFLPAPGPRARRGRRTGRAGRRR